MLMIERIQSSTGRLLATVVRADFHPDTTTFVTSDDLPMQVGFVVYAAGGEIQRHTHRPIERSLVGTSETLVVREGRCTVEIYDVDRALVATVELGRGDLVSFVAGGHGFRMSEDTVLLEVKQGPYTGQEEKEQF